MLDIPEEGIALPPPLEEKRVLRNLLGLVLQMVGLVLNLWFSVLMAAYRFFVTPEQKDISGQVVLITGTGRGLGQALAWEFARKGCKVVCADIQTDLNKRTVKEINEYAPGTAKCYFCDVGKLESVEELKAAVLKDFGRVDIVVNNAGLIIGGSVLTENFKVQLVETVARVNFLSHLWMTRTFLPEMVERNSGHIVAISSMSSLNGLTNGALYCSCKWAVTGFMESLRDELRLNRNNKVQTSVALPFFINTSSTYMKLWEARLPELSVENCAKEIVRGVRENQVIFSIPKEQYYAACFVKLLPMNVRDQFYNIFQVKVKDYALKELEPYKGFKIASGEYKPPKTT